MKTLTANQRNGEVLRSRYNRRQPSENTNNSVKEAGVGGYSEDGCLCRTGYLPLHFDLEAHHKEQGSAQECEGGIGHAPGKGETTTPQSVTHLVVSFLTTTWSNTGKRLLGRAIAKGNLTPQSSLKTTMPSWCRRGQTSTCKFHVAILDFKCSYIIP